jgi:hypothetical protein
VAQELEALYSLFCELSLANPGLIPACDERFFVIKMLRDCDWLVKMIFFQFS